MTDFTYSGTIALDTIAVSGIYGITAIGAAGGATSGAATGGSGGLGGLGAKVSGDIFLQAGSVLEIVAGGEGGESFAGGGGGGSFVIETNNGTSAVDIVLAVAGGGGGGGPIGTGGNGLTTENGGNGGGSLGSGGAGGSNGNGGAGGNAGGGGGGGINEDGGTSVDGPNGGGKDPANGFYGGVGGIETGSLGNGGYGGGGGAGFYTGGRYHGFGGGGGGGYGGGGGGAGTTGGSYGDRVSAGGGGGGGGSYYEDLIGGTATPAIGTANGDVQITPLFPICYLAGTHILTTTGPAPVESLKIGDTVITRFSGIRPIKWIGRQTFAPHFLAPEKFPVRIAAGALGENLPTRDLCVSPGHSMLLGDILILAANLINGATITQTPPTEEIAYFQLDLGAHDCILAEGAWSETYADAPCLRAQFHNAAEYETLYPNDPPPEDLTLCAPRPDSGPRLESALRLLPYTRRMGGAPREAHA